MDSPNDWWRKSDCKLILSFVSLSHSSTLLALVRICPRFSSLFSRSSEPISRSFSQFPLFSALLSRFSRGTLRSSALFSRSCALFALAHFSLLRTSRALPHISHSSAFLALFRSLLALLRTSLALLRILLALFCTLLAFSRALIAWR
jgi:hypothetical protein